MRPRWYLSEVKEKENRTWTDEEKINIYTLRYHNRMPAKKVARIYKASLVQIYNITRLFKKGLKKCCYRCGKHLTDEEILYNKEIKIKLCNKCKKEIYIYKSTRRKKALEKGLCSYCEVRPIIPGHTGCKKCLSATHRRRNKKGLCGICGKNPIVHKDGALCKSCINMQSIYAETKMNQSPDGYCIHANTNAD